MKQRIISLLIVFLAVSGLYATTPKYIFYFIGDGMGMGHIMSAQTYNREVLKNSEPLLMMQFPVASFAMTYSYQNPITDSAAAGTALSTGNKTWNGMLGMNHDSIPVNSIAKILQNKGYGIAITTTVPPDDATPGAFYAHQPSRKMFYEIGKDMATSGYAFFAGSQLRGTKNEDGKDNDLIPTLKKSGYAIANGMKEFEKIKNKDKILLLSPENTIQVGYTIDSIAGALTLPQITKSAIDHMKRVSPKKFFIMVEGGNIDWAAHSNDGGTVIKEILNFNESLKLAYDFYLAHPDETLIVLTADHDTGGMTIGLKKGSKLIDMSNIDYQRMSKDEFSAFCKAKAQSGTAITWDEMKGYLSTNFGLFDKIKLTEKEVEGLKDGFEDVYEKHESKENKTLYNSFNGFVESVFKLLDRKSGFGWTANTHTGNPVPVFAIGANAHDFSKISNNTEIPQRMAKAAGIELK
ncbi:MAG: alkaline phosphatase [Muribaculaceae bacterium]|nr:alkaline phosphatase [Muribaculaceae bacterium]